MLENTNRICGIHNEVTGRDTCEITYNEQQGTVSAFLSNGFDKASAHFNAVEALAFFENCCNLLREKLGKE